MGEIGEIITGNTPSKSNEEYYGNKYPFFKPTDLDSGYFVTEAQDNLSIKGFEISRKLPIKSILVTCIGATIGKTGFIRREGTCNQQINAIIASKLIFSEYIYLLCISPYFQNEIIKNASATTLPIINKSKFEKLFLPLPPLAEQKRIVEKIEELLALVDDLETNKTDLQSYIKQAKTKVLEMAVRGELVSQNPDDEPASVLLERIKNEQKTSKSKGKITEHNTHYEEELPFNIPENWVWCRLGEITKIIQYGVSKSAKSEGLYRLLRITDIQYNKVIWENVPFTDIKEKDAENFILENGDFLFARTGATVGKSYLVEDLVEKSVFASYLIRISLLPNNNINYIKYFFNSEFYWQQISEKSIGIGQPNVNGTSLKELFLPLPPLAEQHRIVEKIEHILAVLEELEENIL